MVSTRRLSDRPSADVVPRTSPAPGDASTGSIRRVVLRFGPHAATSSAAAAQKLARRNWTFVWTSPEALSVPAPVNVSSKSPVGIEVRLC